MTGLALLAGLAVVLLLAVWLRRAFRRADAAINTALHLPASPTPRSKEPAWPPCA